jgi:hypothetical protein
LRAGTLDKKIDNFLPGRLGVDSVFQNADKPGWRFPYAIHGAVSALRAGQDSGMAPQAIEISQNGLGNGDPPARYWEAESIRRIPHQPSLNPNTSAIE